MFFSIFKFLFYFVFIYLVAQLVSLEGFSLGTASEYSEASLTEHLQEVFILISALLFVLSSKLNESLKPVSLLLTAFMLMMFVRESDAFLDEYVFDGAWQTLVALIAIVALAYLWSARKNIKDAAVHYSHLVSSGFLMAGLLVVLGFSRLMGRGSFWHSVMGDEYTFFRNVKNIVEEGTELLGYSLIVLAAVELVGYCVKARMLATKPQTKELAVKEVSFK